MKETKKVKRGKESKNGVTDKEIKNTKRSK